MTGRVDGRFELLDRLGTGGMAEVWRAHDDATGATVAIKRLHAYLRADDAALERFRREANASAAVRHPRAVGVREARIDVDEAYLVMDFVPGGSLAERLARDRPLPPAEAVRIAAEVAEVLGVAHREGIVHRDVTPGNILLDPEVGARLADFGIARPLADELEVTSAGDVVGTLRYLAPEILAGAPPTPESDVWSLGAVLYESLSEGPVTGEASPTAVLEARQAPPSPIAGLPARLNGLLARMLDPDPAARPADGMEAAARLRDVAATLSASGVSPEAETMVMEAVTAPIPASPAVTVGPTPAQRTPARPAVDGGRSRIPTAVAAALAVALLGLTVLAAGPILGPEDRRDVSPSTTPSSTGAQAEPSEAPGVNEGADGGGDKEKGKGNGKGKGNDNGRGKKND